MKIVYTALFLITTLILIPVFTFFFGTPIGPLEISAVRTLVAVNILVILLCFVVSELSKNYSQVDKIWSITPIIFTWIVAYYGGFSSRLFVMALLVTFWGVRLTYNFSRRGAYVLKLWQGEEDYRWAVLRAKKEFNKPWKWTLFNFFFISLYQNTLLLLITLPTIVVLQNNSEPIGFFDYLVALLMFCLIVFEAVADNQQFTFQTRKWKLINEGKELDAPCKKGFNTTGLWGLSRHLNYFAEQGVWVCMYLFSVIASGFWLNWSVIGCLLLIVLFKSSSDFSEEISSGKYPEYKKYQEQVRRFIPLKK